MNLSGINAVENIIDNCTDNYNISIRNKLYEIDDILDEFEFTSFGIGGEINESQKSIKEQNNNLSDFRESVSIYNHEVIEMENNTAGKLKMIAGIGEGKESSENQIGDNAPVEFIPTFSSSAQYIPGQIVKIKGTDGKWYIGTAQIEELVGTGGYKKFKFVPNNKEYYDNGMSVENTAFYKFCNNSTVREVASFISGFTPIDFITDIGSFIAGIDVITGKKCNRGILAACIVAPGVLDSGLKQAAKHSDEVGEFIVKNSDDIINDGKNINGRSSSRLIPGTEGAVTGGNSTKLGKNMLEDMGVPRSTKWTGHQAQHIIPAEMAEHPVLKKIGIDLDDASNGLFLRTPEEDVSAMSRHRGYHSTYNEFVKKQLDSMDINQSVDVLQRQVYELQSNLRTLQQNGLPLYPNQGATIDLWERSLNRIK